MTFSKIFNGLLAVLQEMWLFLFGILVHYMTDHYFIFLQRGRGTCTKLKVHIKRFYHTKHGAGL